MSLSKGTPLSSQIIWLENRVQELEEENEKLLTELGKLTHSEYNLKKENAELKDKNHAHCHKIINLEVEVAGHKEQIKQSYRDKLAANNFSDELDKEFTDRLYRRIWLIET